MMLQSLWEQYGERKSRFRNLTLEQGRVRIWGEIIRGKESSGASLPAALLHLDDPSSTNWKWIQDHLLDRYNKTFGKRIPDYLTDKTRQNTGTAHDKQWYRKYTTATIHKHKTDTSKAQAKERHNHNIYSTPQKHHNRRCTNTDWSTDTTQTDIQIISNAQTGDMQGQTQSMHTTCW